MKVRVNFTIDENLLETLDNYCKSNYGISRSTAIAQFVANGLGKYFGERFNGDVDAIAAYCKEGHK